eukprot:m.248463 g.248463  ORF g.248463 m.248463 type:complete len:160 (+) comp17164_c1_seq17:2583-3062(+)
MSSFPIIKLNPPLAFYGVVTLTDFLIGGAWYSSLFKTQWIKGMREDKSDEKWPESKEMNMGLPLAFSVFSSAASAHFTAHTLAHLLYGLNGVHRVESNLNKIMLGVGWLFVGFQFVPAIESALWANRPQVVVGVNMGRALVRMLNIGLWMHVFGVLSPA